MGTCETWCSTRFSIGSITVSYIHINDLSLGISKLTNLMLFADDMSNIVSNTNPEEFKNNINSVMTEITNWFQSNL